VWIDALSNYYSALGLPAIGDEYDNSDAKYWPANVHLIGKDILWFHAVYWPCFLMALEIPLPKCVFAHGWWTSEGQKMSKSLGNFISREQIAQYCEQYSRDVYRYYLLRSVTFGSDGDFAHDMVQQVYNADLANGVGNLLSRTVKMIAKYFDGAIPAPAADVEDVRWVKTAAEALHNNAVGLMDAFAFGKYLEAISTLVGATNKFIDDTEPFKLAKDESQRGRLATVLYTCAEAVRIVLLYLAPVMPDKSTAGLARLGVTLPAEPLSVAGAWGTLKAGSKVDPGEPLFPRAEKDK